MKSQRRKALLSIAFASSLINSQPLEVAAKEVGLPLSAIQQLATNPKLTQELKAYYMLRLAEEYLNEVPPVLLESQFDGVGREDWLKRPEQLEKILRTYNENPPSPSNPTSNESQSGTKQGKKLANLALNKALDETQKSSDTSQRLNLYLVACALFRQTGNANGVKNCNSLLEKNIKDCERRTNIELREAIAASYALNTMAKNIIPISIPDLHHVEPANKLFTDEEFKRSERLLRRATAILDRLPTTTHERRKAHRDLSLWYQALNKPELAQKERKTLFSLIGREDESLLYPQLGACGHVVWWEKEGSSQSGQLACGMG